MTHTMRANLKIITAILFLVISSLGLSAQSRTMVEQYVGQHEQEIVG